MTTATITKPETTETADSVEDLDFAQTCHYYRKSTGERCGQPSVAFIEMHKVGQCTDEECNSRGNMEGNVCQEHFDMFMDLAIEIASSAPNEKRCGTCKLPIRQASDILQKVIRL